MTGRRSLLNLINGRKGGSENKWEGVKTSKYPLISLMNIKRDINV